MDFRGEILDDIVVRKENKNNNIDNRSKPLQASHPNTETHPNQNNNPQQYINTFPFPSQIPTFQHSMAFHNNITPPGIPIYHPTYPPPYQPSSYQSYNFTNPFNLQLPASYPYGSIQPYALQAPLSQYGHFEPQNPHYQYGYPPTWQPTQQLCDHRIAAEIPRINTDVPIVPFPSTENIESQTGFKSLTESN